eukprot:SAG22_NODE_1132_length_5437_cov_8.133945_3_plen_367_part_00
MTGSDIEAPLALSAPAGGGAGDTHASYDGADPDGTSSLAPALLRLPAAGLLEVTLPFYVAGPFGRPESAAAHRAALAASFVGLLAVQLFVLSLVSSLPMYRGHRGSVVAETSLAWVLCAAGRSAIQHKTWQALYRPSRGGQGRGPGGSGVGGGGGGGQQADNNSKFISELLRADVLPSTARRVRRFTKQETARQAKLWGLGLGLVPFPLLFGALAWFFERSERSLTAAERLSSILWVPTMPLVCAQLIVPALLAHFLSAAMADRVEQVTRSVRSATAATADYARLIREIHRVDAEISRLTGFLQFVCLEAVVGEAVFGALPFLVIGFGLVPPAAHWWTRYGWNYIFGVLMVALMVSSISIGLRPDV